MAPPKFQTVDAYIASFPKEVQVPLRELRTAIRTTAPDAQEKISYQIPTFTLHGRNLVHFAGWKKHIGLYPVPLEAFEKELSSYEVGKGTVRFPLNQPMPLALIRKIVKYRAKEHLERSKK